MGIESPSILITLSRWPSWAVVHELNNHDRPDKTSQRGAVSEAASGCSGLCAVQYPGLCRPLREGRLPCRSIAYRAGGPVVSPRPRGTPSFRRPSISSQALDSFKHGMTQLDMLVRQSTISRMFPQERHVRSLRQQWASAEPHATAPPLPLRWLLTANRSGPARFPRLPLCWLTAAPPHRSALLPAPYTAGHGRGRHFAAKNGARPARPS